MKMLKYSCPQCGYALRAEIERAMSDELCDECGNVFMPSSCRDLSEEEVEMSMPPLPEIVPPPRKLSVVRKPVAANVVNPPRATRSVPVSIGKISYRDNNKGSYLNVVLATMLLFLPFSIFAFTSYSPKETPVVLFIMFLVWPLPALLVSWVAYSKGRKFWFWWMTCWFLPGVNFVTFIAVLVVEPLSLCSDCGMRIPRSSRVCRYCRN